MKTYKQIENIDTEKCSPLYRILYILINYLITPLHFILSCCLKLIVSMFILFSLIITNICILTIDIIFIFIRIGIWIFTGIWISSLIKRFSYCKWNPRLLSEYSAMPHIYKSYRFDNKKTAIYSQLFPDEILDREYKEITMYRLNQLKLLHLTNL